MAEVRMDTSPKTVVISGASGLLGRAVLEVFQEAGWRTIGLAFSRAHLHPNLVKLDVTDKLSLAELIRREKPTAIVHCAAEKSPDVAENRPEETKKLNVDATKDLAQLSRDNGIFFIYISTDYVFDGKSPPYQEDSEPHALNKYGESKLAGEQAVLSVNPDGAVILRIPVLYGRVEKLSESAVTVLFEKLLDTSKPAKLSHYEQRYPTHARDVGAAAVLLANERLKSASVKGIYHRSASERMTKYEMVCKMADVFGLSAEHIKPDSDATGGAIRPYDSALSCERLRQLNVPPCIAFTDGIRNVLASFLKAPL